MASGATGNTLTFDRPGGHLRRFALISGIVLLALGLTAVAWGAATWRWGDPVTALYTKRAQAKLASELDDRRARFAAEAPRAAAARARAVRDLGALASAYRTTLGEGDAVGRLRVPRLGLNVVVVWGTQEATLRKGPGLHRSTRLPGQRGLIYVAGHRTTYQAPFAHLERLRPGNLATVETPYGTFRYEVTGTRIVDDQDLSVLAPTRGEILRLQACHPRFRGTQRMIVSARLVSAAPPA